MRSDVIPGGTFPDYALPDHLDPAAFQSKVAVAYTQVVTISTDERHVLQEFRASVGAQWTFLSDPGRTVQKDLDIQEYTARSAPTGT